MQEARKRMGHIKEFLRSSDLFENLTDSELDKLTRLCREEAYETGAIIFKEGEMPKDTYIVKDGRVVLEMEIRLRPGSERRGAIGMISKGQTFAWSAITESQALTMSARCIEKTNVIALDGASFRRLLEENSDMGLKVMRGLVRIVGSRLIQTRDTLAHILSIASHDLKAPLAAVESYHQVMLGGYAGEITQKAKNMLLRSSERITGLLDLIDNILDISRIDTGELKMEAMSLLKVVESSRGVIEPLAKDKGLQLKVEVPKELPLITGAPNRLQQVFDNLLGNAVKFTPEGGTITLRIVEGDSHILVEIMDSGVGISHEDLPRIFDDFYQGIRVVDSTGAGLGLSISRKIIEAHGGKIWVESPCPESGMGSKFSFTLPKNPATIRGE